jgi:hypothetical protein
MKGRILLFCIISVVKTVAIAFSPLATLTCTGYLLIAL